VTRTDTQPKLGRRAAIGTGAALAVTPKSGWAQATTLRIGAPLPLTGGLAPEGSKQKRGYDYWLDAVNAAGGIEVGGKRLKVEIVYADYESNTPRAVQLAERMITQDNCPILLAPFGSGATKAASSVAERYKVPLVAPTASSREVYDQGYRFLFGTFTPNESITEPLAEMVHNQFADVTKVAILARNDLFPLAIAQEMDKSAKARGLQVTVFDKYAIGTMDHASALTGMAEAKPDWVFVTGYLNDLILVRQQMVELRFTAPVISMIAGPAYKEFRDALGANAENLTSAAWWDPSVRYTGCQGPWASTEAFNAGYTAKYGGVPDYGEASAAACGVVIQLAAAAAGSVEPGKLRDALAALDAPTFYGQIKFGPTGQVVSLQPPVFQIQGGKVAVLFPKDIAQAQLRRV
jgi:branched-chain amino acid transport system substrate-binding protein